MGTGSPMNKNDSTANKWHQRGLHVRQKEPAPSAEVRRTTPQRLCVRRPTCPRTCQVLRAQEDVRVYAELQSKQRKKKRSSVMGKRPGLVALVGHEGRWVTSAGLVPICPRCTLVDLTPKYLILVARTPW